MVSGGSIRHAVSVGWARRCTTTFALVLLFAVGAVSPAWAHGSEHDVRRVAVGDIDGAEITVWTADAPTSAGLPMTIGGDGIPSDAVVVVTTPGLTSGVTAVAIDRNHWTAVVPVADGSPTTVEVQVDSAAHQGVLRFEYVAPTATWWMKAIVIAALFQGAVSAGWLVERRQRVFGRLQVIRAAATQSAAGG